MKKLLLVLFAISFALTQKAYSEDFSSVYNGDTIYYNITSSVSPFTVGVTYKGYSANDFLNEYSGAVTIPDSVEYNSNYYKVTSIGDYAFVNCYGLTSIILGNSVTSIGLFAFSVCSGLTSITIPNSVTSIDVGAFVGCSGLTSITIPNSITSINDNVFDLCSGLTSITIPNSVTSIGLTAFRGCTGLTSITIPSSVISIGDDAFSECYGLTSVNIPNSVTTIGERAFMSCNSLTSLTLPSSLTSIEFDAFYNCNSLTSITSNAITPPIVQSNAFYNVNKSIPLYIPCHSLSLYQSNIYWSEFTNKIGFKTPQFLTTSICEGETYSNYGANLDSAGVYTLVNGCDSVILTLNINPPYRDTVYAKILQGQTYTQNGFNENITGLYTDTLQSINGCDSIITLNLSVVDTFSVVNNEGKTIYYKLTSSVSPQTVTVTYKGSFFYSYSEYDGNIIIPDSVLYNGNYYKVTSISDYAFADSYGLTSLSIPNSITSIGEYAFYHCMGMVSVNIPASIAYIGSSAFKHCNGLTSITIPNSVTTIGESTFYDCNNLTSIIIPNSITSIGSYAFSECIGLTSITIPNSVNLISYSAFQYCTGLTSINCEAATPPSIQSNTFYNVSQSIPVYVPCGSDSLYHAASYWSSFPNIQGEFDSDTIIFDTICQGEILTVSGYNFDTAGIYTLNLDTYLGCDSIVTLNLFVNPTYNDTIYSEICQGESFTLNGFNVNTAGLHTQTLQTINGCDSILNLSLVVNPTYNDTIIAEICQGETYTLNGFNENIAGFYTQTLQTIKGCDSIVNLTLTINQPATTNLVAEICQGETYTLNGFNESVAGFYTQTLQTNKGCDSIVNLNLIVNPISYTTYYDTVCQGVIYNNYGFNFNADTSGIYNQNLQTINGCDSTIVLNLVVNPTPSVPYNIDFPSISFNRVDVIWQGNALSYDIYRNDSLIANVNSNYYVDSIVLIIGETYCYKVKAINGDCESEISDDNCFYYYGLNNINQSNISTKLYPNPTEGKARLEVEGLTSEADVLVYDMVGRVIQTYKINQGTKELEIDLSTYAKGVYSIRIVNKSINQTKKLIVQ